MRVPLTFLVLMISGSLEAARNLIPIETIRYDRNDNASYCRLNPLVFDTIVFHHTQTTSTTTAQQINQLHLNRGTPDDPWLMIGYHFVINSSYNRGPRVNARVTKGRDLEIAGSHAGSTAFTSINRETRETLERNDSVLCGTKNGQLQIPSDKFNSEGLAKVNYHTIAVAVIGNYVVRGSDNPGGYPPGAPRFPTEDTIEASARLACQLQKKMPRVKKLSYHGFYRATSCPGLIENRLQQIREKAKEYGCVFK
jgi:hypothetical protein